MHLKEALKMNQCQGQDTTEKSILCDTTNEWFDTSSMNQDQFAVNLGELLGECGLLDVPQQNDGTAYLKWEGSIKKRISRIFKGETPFPLEWRFAWLSLLPAELKAQAQAKTLAFMGLMPVPLPASIGGERSVSAKANLVLITHLFSQLIARSGPAHDGVYDDKDCKFELQVLSDQYMSIITQCTREVSAIESVGVQPRVLQIFANSPLFKRED